MRLVLAAGLLAGSMGGCKCQKDVIVDEGPLIDRPPIVEKNPQADSPEVRFPPNLHSGDESLNRFVEKSLSICSRGDYDGFRQLFGTAFEPIAEVDFERVWGGVRDIVVSGIYPDPRKKDPPEYYVHAIVQLRSPDSKGRRRRDVVVWIFQEAGEWRMGQAPGEIVNKVLLASTRPAEGVSAGDTSP